MGAMGESAGVLEWTAALSLLEYAAVSAVLARHPTGIVQAERAGLQAGMIQSSDLRAIYIMCDVARRKDKCATLGLIVKALQHVDCWSREGDGPWTCESLLDFARHRDGEPTAHEWAVRMVRVHQIWEAVTDSHGPAQCLPTALGRVAPVRIGLELARLARWTQIPVEWIHHEFVLACVRRDARHEVLNAEC